MLLRFSVFEFESDTRELRKSGRVVALESQPARALARLLAKSGEAVTREELRDAVWGAGTHVDFDRGLAYCLSQIRFALGDSGENPRFVQTLPKKGYRFIAPVSGVSASPGTPGVTGATPAVETPRKALRWWPMLGSAVVGVAAVVGWLVSRAAPAAAPPAQTVIAVSIFDNETGQPEHDRLVAGLSDLVVTRLTALEPARVAVIGNAAEPKAAPQHSKLECGR